MHVVLHPLNVGAHISKHSTILQTLEHAIYNRLHVFQLYLCSPRGYHVTVPTTEDIQESRELLRQVPNARVFVHSCLLYNLCSSKPDQLEKTIKGLQLELDIVAAFGGHGVVVHPGSHPNEELALRTISKSIDEVINTFTPTTTRLASAVGLTTQELCSRRRLLLENCAGEGNKVYKNLEQLQKLPLNLPQVGVCIDTAHLHSAGDWDCSKQLSEFFEAFNDKIGLNKLWLVHLNDSAVPFGAKRDRHEAIGEGSIFTDHQTFENLILLLAQHRIPAVMELPVPALQYIEMARQIYDTLKNNGSQNNENEGII